MNELFQEFQQFRKILCVCPCCGEIVRVSDLRLKAKGPAVRTWLDDYRDKEKKIDRKEERFDEREEGLREQARERGRKLAERVFNQAILPSFKALKLDPFDMKPLLNPVDFVAFKGMTKKEYVSEILFLSKRYNRPALNLARKQIAETVHEQKYDWQLARIDERGDIEFE